MNKTPLIHIGTIELVNFPDDQINGVPAKIDTGADGSVIWASSIRLQAGKLIFNFFAPGSAFYRSEPVETTAYKVTSIKNSFGDTEFRYKIRLNIQVGDHTLRRWFSLADRSNNNYPILLGKNFLKNHFVVDVSQKFLVSKPNFSNKVLVLSTQPTADFFKQVSVHNKSAVKYVTTAYNSLLFHFDQANTYVSNVNDKDTDIAEYAFTYFKSHAKHAELAGSVAEYLRFRGRPFADHEIGRHVSASKLTQYMQLSCNDVPIPTSISGSTELLKSRYQAIVKELGLPFVLKEVASDKGKNNYLIASKKDFNEVLLAKGGEHLLFLAQKYIENDGFLRVYIMDKEVELAIWRRSYPHKNVLKAHLNKPTGGKNAELVDVNELDGEVHDLAIRAAVCLDRQIAGVDLVQDKQTKKWYILEVNNAPQIKSGSFVDEKVKMMARFIDQELRK